MLNSLKFYMTAIVILHDNKDDKGMVAKAAVILILVSALPILFSSVLYIKRVWLEEEKNVKTWGTLYIGRDVLATHDHRAWLAPIAFFLRRLLFVIIAVHLFDKPLMQLFAHQALVMATVVYMVHDGRAWRDKGLIWVEVGSEMALMMMTVLAQECLRQPIRSEEIDNVTVCLYVTLGLLLAGNIAYMIYAWVQQRREKKRKKWLEKMRKEAIAQR